MTQDFWKLLALGLLLLAVTSLDSGPEADEALCQTDTECALLCPAGDSSCDGGPEWPEAKVWL